ncbi:MAG: DNA polymerase II large subunit [Candidatus Altiarchaeota archaeon]|nr:DNA polymerase II large subunit [Candidatus Altiarchaeota archaeon]
MILRKIGPFVVKEYHKSLEDSVAKVYEVAKVARAKNLDPSKEVEILTASELAGRVESLVSIAVPELAGSGMRARILELEKHLGKGNEEIGFIMAEETAKGRFFKFEDKVKAIEAGMRVGTAYWTLGVTTAPLEGLTHVKIKKRMDGGDYLAIYFSGPIRSAGGTSNAMIVMLADFLRKKFGIDSYDPTPQEIERYFLELESYHGRITRLQYMPGIDEVKHMIKNLPVEVNGEATEKIEVLAYKDLPRVETNRIRGGMVLTLSMITLKAKKLIKRMKHFGEKYELTSWEWLKGLSEKKKAAETQDNTATYIAEIPGGRPVFGYPGRTGGFSLRYGRARDTGFAALGLNPATMIILGEFIAVGTQLKTEFPGKSAAVSPVDSVEGPIVKLKNGSVVKVNSEVKARQIKKDVEEILYNGEILVAYGEFLTNGHKLKKPSWCVEWWEKEVEAKGGKVTNNYSFEDAVKISKDLGVALHPKFTHHWEALTGDDVKRIQDNLEHLNEVKPILEKLGLEHMIEDDKLSLNEVDSLILHALLEKPIKVIKDTGLETLNLVSPVKIVEKAGSYLGARMGRPEKAERRLMVGKPNVLFPAGKVERMRNLVEALKSNLRAELALRVCPKCSYKTYYTQCDKCKTETKQRSLCIKCGVSTTTKEHCGMRTKKSSFTGANDKLEVIANKLGVSLPPLIKGVRGLKSDTKIPERLEKGILRAKYELFVNKDGTTRIDATDMPLTHFKPKEIEVSVEKLKSLGYSKDRFGKPLEHDDQVIELLPQDILLSDNEYFSSGDYLLRISKFVDDLLEKFYGLEPFYKLEKKEDLIGQVVIGLAPHTSAGIIARIIGFSKVRSGYAHPVWHASKKRNCDGDEDSVILLLDALLNFSKEFLPMSRGGRTMDVPLVITTILDLEEVDDEVLDMDVVSSYPLEFYKAAIENKYPWDVSIKTLGKYGKMTDIKFTHTTSDVEAGPIITAYRSLGPMMDKVKHQLELAERIRAVNENDVAERILSSHFLKDIKGNLRQFSNQGFRCVKCNDKYRRFPLFGKCEKCSGRIIFTVHEGTVKKYYESSVELAKKYKVSNYIIDQLKLLEKKMDLAFGVKEKQEELDQWFN